MSVRSVCGGAGTISFSAILRSVAEFESAPASASARSGAIAVAKRGDGVVCDCSFAGWFTCATAGADDFGANEIVFDEYRTWNNSTRPIRIEPTMRPSRASEGTEPGSRIDNDFSSRPNLLQTIGNIGFNEVARSGTKRLSRLFRLSVALLQQCSLCLRAPTFSRMMLLTGAVSASSCRDCERAEYAQPWRG